MSGDLYIENVTFNDRKLLESVGATFGTTIEHADRDYYQHRDRLLTQVGAAEKDNSRKSLPAHAYIEFPTNWKIGGSAADVKLLRARLAKFLSQVTRPLGLISKAPKLGQWPTKAGEFPADQWELPLLRLEEALHDSPKLTLEYYKYDGYPLMTVFPDPGTGKNGDWVYAKEK